MDTKQLLCFMKVYEYHSIHLAAKDLFISPQGLSKTIQKLESELNTPLFERKSTGVFPTAAGDSLYVHGQTIMKELQAINDHLYQPPKKELVIGCTDGIIRMLTVKFLYDFQAQYPQIPLRLYDNTDTALEKKLWEDELKLCIISGPINTIKYNATFLTSCPVCVVTNINNPLAQLSEISMKDLSHEPLIVSGREYYANQSRLNSMLQRGSIPNIVLETMDIDYHAMAASQGYASALTLNLPEFLGNYPNIKVIPFRAEEQYTWDTFLVYKKGLTLNEREKNFYTFLISWIRTNRPDLLR